MDEFEVRYVVTFDHWGNLPAGWPDVREDEIKEFAEYLEEEAGDYIPEWPFSELQEYALANGYFDLSGAPDWWTPDNYQTVDWFSYDERLGVLELIRPWFED